MNAAGDIPAFSAARIPVPCTASMLPAVSADAKGSVMLPGVLCPAIATAAARQGRALCRVRH